MAGAAGWAEPAGEPSQADHLGISLLICCAHGSRNGDAKRAQLVAQAVARNTQELSRLQLVSPGVAEHAGEQLPLHYGQCFGVEICRPGVETVGEKAFP